MRCSFKNIIMAAGVLSDDAKDNVRSLGFGDSLDLTVESLQSRERIKPKTKEGKKPRKEKETRIKLDIFIQYMKGIRDVDKQVKCFL
jgi:hypothetical protein